jgi:hypothetical protein
MASSFEKHLWCNCLSVDYLFPCISKFWFSFLVFFFFNFFLPSEVTCFIYKKICLLQCKDRRFMGCPWGRIWWACEKANEFLGKATRIPSCLCQSQRWEIRVRTGFFCLIFFTYFYLELTYLNSDAWSVVSFCNVSLNNILRTYWDKYNNGSHNFCQVVLMGMDNGSSQ